MCDFEYCDFVHIFIAVDDVIGSAIEDIVGKFVELVSYSIILLLINYRQLCISTLSW